MKKGVKHVFGYQNIDGLIPGVRGQRAFPTSLFKHSDPFLMLDHIGPQKVGADFKLDGDGHEHPHRGFETITFMFEGGMDHRDSIGNKAALYSGSVQRMNAGSGIIHGGDMRSDRETERFHEMQLWINNPISEKMSTPEIHNVSNTDIPVFKSDGTSLRIISGILNGQKGPIETKANTQIGHVISETGGSISIDSFAADDRVMVYILEGELIIDEKRLNQFDLAELTDGDSIHVELNRNTQALILAGTPLNEPVTFGGPFVMNSQEEIQQAYVDYQNGKFGAISA